MERGGVAGVGAHNQWSTGAWPGGRGRAFYGDVLGGALQERALRACLGLAEKPMRCWG